MTTETYQQAIELIRRDQTANAIELLLQHAHYFQVFQRTKLILLSARLKRLDRQKIKGIIHPGKSDYQLRRNRINDDLLHFLETVQSPIQKAWNWTFYISTITIMLLLGTWTWIHFSPKNDLALGKARYESEQLIIPVFKQSATTDNFDVHFILPQADSTKKLKSKSLLYMEVIGGIEKEILVDDPLDWSWKQGVTVNFPKSGWYELKIPLTCSAEVNPLQLQDHLIVRPAGKAFQLELGDVNWSEYLTSGNWPMLFLMGVLGSAILLLITLLQRTTVYLYRAKL
ncbi:MAG: hypothetical protein F6K19_17380 [Cyanothece sp. SIO1E1]|nr:hypothetical protein [Cyanothece sp. SIO1E1]